VIKLGRLDKFVAKPEKIVVEGEEITIYPLRLRDMSKLFSAKTDEERNALVLELFKDTLKKAFYMKYPDTPREEIDKEVEEIAFDKVQKFMDAFLKVNGLEMDVKKKF